MPRKTATSPLRDFSILGMETIPELVNSEAIEGTYAKHVGVVRRDTKELGKKFFADTTHILIIADRPAKAAVRVGAGFALADRSKAGKTGTLFHVDAFEDEGLYQTRLFENIPDLDTAEMLAKTAWTSLNQYAGYYGRDVVAAMTKYKA